MVDPLGVTDNRPVTADTDVTFNDMRLAEGGRSGDAGLEASAPAGGLRARVARGVRTSWRSHLRAWRRGVLALSVPNMRSSTSSTFFS